MITIFTDGSSRGNPGPGGWGAIVVRDGTTSDSKKDTKNDLKTVTELGGREDHTTNNRMELLAAINGLKDTPSDVAIVVNTDSSYVINGITKWIHGWKKKDWKTLDKKDVVNRDLWESLDQVSSGKKISWNYVGGHVGVVGNERCDEIATSFADNDPTLLFSGSIADYSIKNIMDVSASTDTSEKKTATKSRSNATAYSYVSLVNGVISTDWSWKDCEARVKGKKGARFKKSLNKTDETKIIAEFKGN